MDRDQGHALNELRDRVGRSLDLFYDKIGKHHHAVSGRVAVDFHPPAEVNEQDTSLEISLELPGIDGENVEVIAAEGWLTVRGKKEMEREKAGLTYFLHERAYGSFERSFHLPAAVNEEAVQAAFDKGVLTVLVPKAGDGKRRIAITEGS